MPELYVEFELFLLANDFAMINNKREIPFNVLFFSIDCRD